MRMHDLFRPRLLLVALPVLALVLVAACGSSSGSAGTTPTATSTAGAGGASSAASVNIANFAFAPKTVTVKVGATVTWTNQDSAPHDVTSTNGPAIDAPTTSTFASGTMAQGQTFSFKFTKAGTYYYECMIHKAMPAMHATVIVK